MDSQILSAALNEDLAHFFKEDDLSRNTFYTSSLPINEVECSLKIKDDLVLAGLPYFVETFRYLGVSDLDWNEFRSLEGKTFSKDEGAEIHFTLPFNVALTGERIALNLLQHASAIATFTYGFVTLAQEKGVKILDTRKTTPGLRSLEKYAVRVGGGFNHRLGQTDMWMIKDNHKNFFGGLKGAYDFFKGMNGFYTPIEAEIHDLDELEVAKKLGIRHVMLDNFSPENIRDAIQNKIEGMTYEVSGGIREHNIEDYLIEGVDAISIGALTYAAPAVDISLKYQRV